MSNAEDTEPDRRPGAPAAADDTAETGPDVNPPTPEQTPDAARAEDEPSGRSPGEAFPKDEEEGAMEGGAPTG